MAGMKRKLNFLAIEEKLKIPTFLGENPLMKYKKKELGQSLVFRQTLSTIIKNREMMEQKFQEVLINGMMLQRKADNFAKKRILICIQSE